MPERDDSPGRPSGARARTGLPGLADSPPGRHFTTLGADEPGTQELSADLLGSALHVVDDRDLAGSTAAPAGAGLPPEVADTTLGEPLDDSRPGRRAPQHGTLRLRARRAPPAGPGRRPGRLPAGGTPRRQDAGRSSRLKASSAAGAGGTL
ncbi:hypothetical protein [Streptomyces sp. NPDC047985]|uniref:hypothetical protein n=1 Tax=Streptomyces sp. NPDC047985 TaxID=3155384 RepID=UPI00344AAC70